MASEYYYPKMKLHLQKKTIDYGMMNGGENIKLMMIL